jgi:hypothetical protein
MALSVPLQLIAFPDQFLDLDGKPLASGFLSFLIAGTTTPGVIYADDQGAATVTNPAQLDSSGFLGEVYGSNNYLYDVAVLDSSSTQLYTRRGVGNPVAIAFGGLGNLLAQGSLNQSSGYAVLSTDNLVTVASTGGANPCIINLPAASTRSTADAGSGMLLTIKNLGTVPLAVTPAGSDTIETIAAAYAVAASASPLFRTITLVSDGESAWYVTGGIGV